MIQPDDTAGIGARTPLQVPTEGWLAILKRTWAETGDDNIGLIAAGVAFYAFSAIVPLLAAVVLSYGLFADADTVQRNIEGIFSSLPRDAAAIISDQLLNVVRSSKDKQGLGLAIAILIAFYGATKGASAIVTGLNVAYDTNETRGFFRVNLLYFGIVAGGVALIFLAILATGLLAFLEGLIPGAPDWVLTIIRLVGYVVLAGIVITAASALFYVGPDLPQPRWLWLSPGSAGATVLWLAGTAGFGVYVANFGNYGATYGSLSAVIVMLTWLWLSAYVFLLGAELNAELERQVEGKAAVDLPVSAPQSEVVEAASPAAPNPKPSPSDHESVAVAGATLAGGGLIATAGLMLLRRGKPAGAAAVALAAALAWRKGIKRQRAVEDGKSNDS